MNRIANRTQATLAAFLLPAAAFAHDRHGATGAHWHATDTWGLLVLGCMLALALWLGRRHK